MLLKVPRIRKRRATGKDRATEIVQMRESKATLSELRALQKDFKQATGKTLTRAYVFREGGRLLMRRLRVQLNDALNGRHHAKKRQTQIKKRAAVGAINAPEGAK